MNSTVAAAALFFRNKAIAIVVLLALMYGYRQIPELTYDMQTGQKHGGLPYAELVYACILVLSVFILGGFVRLLIFPEASEYAESGTLRRHLFHGERKTMAYVHYRFATAVSFAIALVCMATLAR